MTGDLIINGKDAFITWGVRMGDGFLDAIDGFNEMKDYIEMKAVLNTAKDDNRQCTCCITRNSPAVHH